jgi:hypothetical protein
MTRGRRGADDPYAQVTAAAEDRSGGRVHRPAAARMNQAIINVAATIGMNVTQTMRQVVPVMGQLQINVPRRTGKTAAMRRLRAEVAREAQQAGFNQRPTAARGTHDRDAIDVPLDQVRLAVIRDPATNSFRFDIRTPWTRVGYHVTDEALEHMGPQALIRTAGALSQRSGVPTELIVELMERQGIQTRGRRVHYGRRGYDRLIHGVFDEPYAHQRASQPTSAEAEQRAERFFLRLLTKEQAKTWTKHGFLMLVSPSGNTYRIKGDGETTYNITKYEHGKPVTRLCAGPERWDHDRQPMPLSDFYTGQVLSLLYDEDHFLKIANPSPV